MEQSILTPNQKKLLGVIVSNPKITNRFYLTGGTALAEFYFQHRLSEDLDFFSEELFVETEIIHWASQTAKKLQVVEVEYKTLNGQLTFFFHFADEVIKVDFAYYPFPHLGDFKKWQTLRIASLEDIGANKIQAIQSRNRGRDFVDLYFILTKGNLTFDTLLANYRTKFEITLSKQELAKQLMKVVDATDQPNFLGETKWAEVEKFILAEAKSMSQEFVE